MQNTTLYPPNRQQLSEHVIGKVVVRHCKTSQLNEIMLAVEPELGEVKSMDYFSFDAPTQSTLLEFEQDAVNQSSAERALARRRLVRRIIQRRYRKKLHQKRFDLEKSVAQLRVEIQRLQEMKAAPPRSVAKMTPWKTVVEHCRLFRYGFRPLVSVSELCSDESARRSGFAYVQTQFCQAVMAPHVQCNAGYGVKAGLENWRLISLYHESLDIELVRLERGAGDSLIACMHATTTITANMIRQALPNLITDDDEHGWKPVAVKLIGQQLVIPGTLRFSWDSTTDKIASTHYEIDMLTPLLALLGSVEDVSSVLDSALAIDHWSTTTCR